MGAKDDKDNRTGGNRVGTDFTRGPVMPMLISFALPFLLGHLLTSLYNTVDSIIVGHLIGSAGFVAVTVGGKTLNLFTCISISLATGGQVFIAQLEGAGQRERTNRAIGTLLTEVFVIAVVLGTFSFLNVDSIVRFMDTPPEAYDQALIYLKITSAGLPFVFGYNAVSAILRGMGDSRRPLIFVAVAAVFNIIGDLVFVIVFDMGVAGTALATIMGQLISLVFSIVVLYRERERFGFDFKPRSCIPVPDVLKTMLRIGLPMAFRDLMIFGTQLIIIGWVNGFGVTEAAAYSVVDKIFHVTVVITISIRQSSSAMMAQNIGAERYDRVKEILIDCYKICGVMVAVLCACALLFPEQIYMFFSEDPAVLAYADIYMKVCCFTYILSNLGGPLDGIVVATGNSRLSMISGILDSLIFRLGFGWFFAYTLGLRGVGLYMGDTSARLVPIILFSIYYFSGRWKKRKKVID